MIVKESDVKIRQAPPNFRERCTLRCLKADSKPSAKGNPQIHLECEIVRPAEYTLGDKTYSIDGMTVDYYFPTKIVNDPDRTADAQSALISFRKLMGLDPAFDDENPETKEYEGLVFEAIINSSENKPRRRNEQGVYVNLKDDDKKDISLGWTFGFQNNGEILRRLEADLSRPY